MNAALNTQGVEDAVVISGLNAGTRGMQEVLTRYQKEGRYKQSPETKAIADAKSQYVNPNSADNFFLIMETKVGFFSIWNHHKCLN